MTLVRGYICGHEVEPDEPHPDLSQEVRLIFDDEASSCGSVRVKRKRSK